MTNLKPTQCTFTHRNVKYSVLADQNKEIISIAVNGDEVKPNNELFKRAKTIFVNMMSYASRIS